MKFKTLGGIQQNLLDLSVGIITPFNFTYWPDGVPSINVHGHNADKIYLTVSYGRKYRPWILDIDTWHSIELEHNGGQFTVTLNGNLQWTKDAPNTQFRNVRWYQSSPNALSVGDRVDIKDMEVTTFHFVPIGR